MVKGGNLFYQLFYLITWLILRTVFRLRITGEKIPLDGGIIVAANHNSYLDPIVVGLCSKRTVSFMAKEELFKVPVLRWIIVQLTTIPVKRGETDIKSIKVVINLLKEGRQIGIFPEGTRKKDSGQSPLFRGVGLIAQKAGAPVYPVTITGTDKIITKGIIPIRFPKIKVTINEPIMPDQYEGKSGQIDISKLAMASIERNL